MSSILGCVFRHVSWISWLLWALVGVFSLMVEVDVLHVWHGLGYLWIGHLWLSVIAVGILALEKIAAVEGLGCRSILATVLSVLCLNQVIDIK